MLNKLSKLIADNIDYDSFYTPGDFQQRAKLWRNLSNRIGVSKLINPRCFDLGNFEYDPQGAIFNTLEELRSNVPAKFLELLEELIAALNYEKSSHIELDLNRCLATFGLYYQYGKLVKSTVSSAKRTRRQRRKMFRLLDSYPAESEALEGAIERYSSGGSDALRQSLDSCRNAIESLLKKLTNTTDWNSAINVLQSESKRKLVKQIYSFLSSRGVHGTTIPSDQDTRLGLSLTEALMLWLITSSGKIEKSK